MPYRLVVLAVLVVIAGLGSQAAERPERTVRAAQPSADTLRFEVTAGKPLIVALPATVDGAAATYSVVEAPALSWLVDRSFIWTTDRRERGRLAVTLARSAATEDTLVLLVDVVP